MNDVVRDMTIYFKSLGHEPQFSVTLGGLVTPSYFEARYRGKHFATQFWVPAGASHDEKKLALALTQDVEKWINETTPSKRTEKTNG